MTGVQTCALPIYHTVNFVSLPQQELGQVRTVLPSDPGDERTPWQYSPLTMCRRQPRSVVGDGEVCNGRLVRSGSLMALTEIPQGCSSKFLTLGRVEC